MYRNAQLPLIATETQARALDDTICQFTACFNAVCTAAWTENTNNGVALHHLTYRTLKTEFPNLVSDLHIQARVKATETIKSTFTRRKHGYRTSRPRSERCTPRYNHHTFKVEWQSQIIKLSTTHGRVEIPFKLSQYFSWARNGKVCTADLIKRHGKFWLNVTIEIPTPVVTPNTTTVGVDLGVNRPAVTSERSFLGKRQWKDVEAKIFRQKRRCQSKRTKSAKRRLKILSGKQARFRRDCDHVLSRQIINSVPAGGTVVLENLTDIRERMKGRKKQRRRLHSWSFAQLRSFVTYKAEMKCVRVELIDPRHTSQTCSKCGHQHRSNRKSQSLFVCKNCGYTLNADLNAAYNVRNKHLGVFGKPLDTWLPSTSPTGRKTKCRGAKAATRKSSTNVDDRR